MHESKSPSTQLEILGDLVTIREAIVSKQLKSPDFLETIIKKGAHSLKFLEHQPEPWLYLMGQNRKLSF